MTTTAISSALLGVSQTNSTTTTDTTTTDFLTLLLAELENQDPTDPMDTAELTSQMATLTQVQQAIQTNEYLSSLVDYASSTNNASAVSCIGKTVTADTSEITVSSGLASENLIFTLAGDASNVTITVCDEAGNTVKTITCEDFASGSYSVTWDGTNGDGKAVDDGTYTFSVSATDSDGNSVTTSTFIKAEVTGVAFNDGVAYLITDAGTIAYGDVIMVSSTS